MNIRADRIVRANGPTLEILEALPPGATRGNPLLFLHGAFAGAWCWSEKTLAYFAGEGRQAAAFSLRAHGKSTGRSQLRHSTVDDFLDDVASAVSRMPAAPILIAHSFGGYLAQLAIGHVPLRALVLVASVPPDGLGLVGAQLALFETSFWIEGVLGSVGRSRRHAALAHVEQLLGEGVAPAERQRFAKLLVPESPIALAQAHVPRWVKSACTAAIPALVLQGGRDRLIWPATSTRTSLYHGADHVTVAEAGHFMMLGPSAGSMASTISAWLDRLDL